MDRVNSAKRFLRKRFRYKFYRGFVVIPTDLYLDPNTCVGWLW